MVFLRYDYFVVIIEEGYLSSLRNDLNHYSLETLLVVKEKTLMEVILFIYDDYYYYIIDVVLIASLYRFLIRVHKSYYSS